MKLIFKIAEEASRKALGLFSGGHWECWAVLEGRQRGLQGGGFMLDLTGRFGLCGLGLAPELPIPTLPSKS